MLLRYSEVSQTPLISALTLHPSPPILHLTKSQQFLPQLTVLPKRCFLHMPAIQQVMPSPMLLHPTHLRPTLHSTREVLLSADVREKVELALSHGWAASTLRGYDSNVKQFRRWCDKENIPQMLQFPADEFVLCAFAASDVGRLGGGNRAQENYRYQGMGCGA